MANIWRAIRCAVWSQHQQPGRRQRGVQIGAAKSAMAKNRESTNAEQHHHHRGQATLEEAIKHDIVSDLGEVVFDSRHDWLAAWWTPSTIGQASTCRPTNARHHAPVMQESAHR